MPRTINDINSTLISICAILDSWCDLDQGLQHYDDRQRHAIHNFLLESYITLQCLQQNTSVPADRKIVYASMLHDMTLEGLRKELRQLLYDYLCMLERLEDRTDDHSTAAISKIDLMLINNHSKIKQFVVQT